MIIDSFSADKTFDIGKKLGQKAKKGDIISLVGDLGVGKTVFTQGFAAGLDIEEPITSPTFTIVQEYETGRINLYHFDVYRLESSFDMEDIGYEHYFFGDGVCLVEWGNIVQDILPKETVYVTIQKDLQKGIDYRSIRIEGVDYENISD